MSSGNGKENAFKDLASQSRAKADTALTTASMPDELEARRRSKTLALDKWASGESGPIDVRDMPGGGVNMALFEDAMKVNDAGRVGRGVGTMSGNANPNFVAALEKENEMSRHKFASGALEQNVEGQLNANNEEMERLYGSANARNMGVAGMREGRYQGDQNRYLQYIGPKPPNFFRQLALSLAQGAAQGASAAAGGA